MCFVSKECHSILKDSRRARCLNGVICIQVWLLCLYVAAGLSHIAACTLLAA